MENKTQDFISKAKDIHGDYYDYSKVDYQSAKTKVIIICPKHNTFEQTPNNHLSGYGCKECGKDRRTKKYSLKKLQEYTDSISNNTANILSENIEYKKTDKILIKCLKHDYIFERRILDHLKSQHACIKCNYDDRRYDNNEWIKLAKDIHGDYYDYSKVDYKQSHDNITIICPKHGEFKQTPSNHVNNKAGCPSCRFKKSSGEEEIANWLNKHNVQYIPQKPLKLVTGKYKNGRLKFDFYIPDMNMAIEYNGEYHYIPMRFGKSQNKDELFKQVQKRDLLKKKYCNNENINLIIIKYDDIIKERLEEIFNKR